MRTTWLSGPSHALVVAVAIAVAVSCAGCVPIPLQVYVADPAVGTPMYSTCAFDGRVPAANEFEVEGVTLRISLAQSFEPRYIELRFDIPAGKTVVLEDNLIRVDFHSVQAPLDARFPDVSLVDGPIRPTRTKAIGKFLVPVTAPLVGERVVRGSMTWDKHFWIGARVDVGSPDDLWITLPPFTIDGVAATIAPLHFRRRTLWGVALMNC